MSIGHVTSRAKPASIGIASHRSSPPHRDLPIVSVQDALDRAFAGEPCDVVQRDGAAQPITFELWADEPTWADRLLFIHPCQGLTLDVGCGPGRLTAALTERNVEAVGIDISPAAIRLARQRGATALCRDIYALSPIQHASDTSRVERAIDNPRGDGPANDGASARPGYEPSDGPGDGRREEPGNERILAECWDHVLLVDGNIGIGGDPVRLLRHIAGLLAPGGDIRVELADARGVVIHDQLRLRIGQQLSPEFRWATVGVDAIRPLAAICGLAVSDIRDRGGRTVATLHQSPETLLSRPTNQPVQHLAEASARDSGSEAVGA